MSEQAVEHPGQAAKNAHPAKQVLRQVGDQGEQQGEAQQPQPALARLDPPAQLPVPEAVHGQVQPAEVHQHRGEQPPPLTAVEGMFDRREIQVFLGDAVVGEAEPADGLQVLAAPGDGEHHQGHQQHQRGQRRLAQAAEAAPWRRNDVALDGRIGVALRIPRVQLAHLRGQCFRHPEHLLTAFLADPARHAHPFQQRQEAAEIGLQRQAQHHHGAHRGASERSTSTHTNLSACRRCSPSKR